MFYIHQLQDNSYAVIKRYDDGKEEQWRIADSYEDALELCHFLNGGTTKQFMDGDYEVYEWMLVKV